MRDKQSHWSRMTERSQKIKHEHITILRPVRPLSSLGVLVGASSIRWDLRQWLMSAIKVKST